MAETLLFTDDAASDIAYCNIRAAKNEYSRKAHDHCERLWKMYEQHADQQFRTAIRCSFDARYWEMYVTTFLMQEGYAVHCPKPGPDVGIEFEGRRIWFEATAPTRGDAADQVPELKRIVLGEVPIMQDVPNEQMILRYLNSISVKYKDQLAAWLTKKIVAPEDAFVIAINPRGLQHELVDADPPRILQAAFALGSPYIAIDPQTSNVVETGYQFRDTIKKSSGAPVSTGVFHKSEYASLSGLLCSRVDAVNQPEQMGADFQFVPNPWAKVPLPERFRLKGIYFRIEQTDDVYTATPETCL
jgi:hypothetical protein